MPAETRRSHVADVPTPIGIPKSSGDRIKAELLAGRKEAQLTGIAGLTQFGANHITLRPGSIAALRHWHQGEDEFVHLLSAGFPASVANASHLKNSSAAEGSLRDAQGRRR